jgi:hypothetical protein
MILEGKNFPKKEKEQKFYAMKRFLFPFEGLRLLLELENRS